MNSKIKIFMTLLFIGLISTAYAGEKKSKKKKVQSFEVTRTIDLPIEVVWAHVADDFAGIAKAHPGLSASHHLEGSPTGGEGCERVCYLDDKQKKYTKEVQKNYNKEDFSFDAQIYEIGGLPLDETVSLGHYKLEKIDENSCKISFTMEYRTKPAFLGGLVKGKFRSQLSDYLLAIDHYLNTGEEVHKENFKAIKKQYKS